MFIISFRTPTWYAVMLVTLLIILGMYLTLRRRSAGQRRKGLLAVCIIVAVLFYVHRFFMFRDAGYLAVYGDGLGEKIKNLLPFQLCYISLVFAVIGLAGNRQRLLYFCFYISSAGALFAMAVPESIFWGVSIWNPSVLLFYLLHGTLLAIYLNIGLLGIIRPAFSKIPAALLILILTGLVMHGINYLGMLCGIQNMNYFYTMDPGGSALLEALWTLLPVRFLYIFGFAIVVLSLYAILVTALFKLRSRFSKT